MKSRVLFICGLFALAATACGRRDLHSTSLQIGVVGETYDDSFYVEDVGWNWAADGTVLDITAGSLPPGITLSASGELTGTPTEVGDYVFRVTAYTFDVYDVFDEDSSVETDSETYDMFVTEASSNTDCPAPDDETANETYICLGTPEYDTLAADSELTLDVNYFTSFVYGDDYDIRTVDFTINYDTNYFVPTESLLNSQVLREAATRAESTVTFSADTPGQLRVVVSATTINLHKSGRFMDLSFTATQDLPAGDYPFTVTLNRVLSSDSTTPASGLVELDGNVSVTTDVSVEEPIPDS